MKYLMLFAIVAFTLNAHAQLNVKWSQVQSISGSIYQTKNAIFGQRPNGSNVWFTSNEHFEPSYDSIKGVIRAVDSTGAVQWTTVIPQTAKVSSFSSEDQYLAGIPMSYDISGWREKADEMGIIYNVTPSTSQLIKVDSTGTLVWNIQLTNINRVSDWEVDSLGNVYVAGRTAETDSAGIKSNGIAIAKYNSAGDQVWKKTKYTTGWRTLPIDISLDKTGRVILCGKRAAKLLQPQTAYDKSFVTVYTNNGNLAWTKEYSSYADALLSDIPHDNLVAGDLGADIADVFYVHTQYDPQTNVPTVKLRKLNGTTGSTVFTKTINNSALRAAIFEWDQIYGEILNIATTTGMYEYDAAGNLRWSNNFITSIHDIHMNLGENPHLYQTIASNVDTQHPQDNYLVKLVDSTGVVVFKKNLSLGNHEEYTGGYAGLAVDPNNPNGIYLLINDTTPPYGTRVTKLSPCSEFTYGFNPTASVTNVNNATCDNGQIDVIWSGPFNSWPHLELWNGGTLGFDIDAAPNGDLHMALMNLETGTYTLKFFDESCGEQDKTVTVKCPSPTGLTNSNITSTSVQGSWNGVACSNYFRLQYRKAGTTAWTTVSNIEGTNYTITNLLPNTGYQWHVANKCNSTGAPVYSNYSMIKHFTTSLRISGTANEEMLFEIAPNPAQQILNVTFTSDDELPYDIILSDLLGRRVLEMKNISQAGDNNIKLNLAELPTGIYSVQFVQGDIKQIEKLIVE